MTNDATRHSPTKPRTSDDSVLNESSVSDRHTANSPDFERELAGLERMTSIELAARYVEAFGKPPRSRHRVWLLRQVGSRLQERRLGGLSGVARRRLDELMSEIRLPGEPSAPSTTRAIGAPRVARSEETAPARAPRALRPGAVIAKRWRDRELRLTVLDDGRFELDGVVHRSLSAAAFAVTGTKWNGNVFWRGRVR